MKWGLFVICIGALMICIAGNPETTVDLWAIASGIFVVLLGFVMIAISSKLKKRQQQREQLEREEAEFAEEQARKKAEASLQKQLDNVEKSRRNSKK